jgi:hypothetical protein
MISSAILLVANKRSIRRPEAQGHFHCGGLFDKTDDGVSTYDPDSSISTLLSCLVLVWGIATYGIRSLGILPRILFSSTSTRELAEEGYAGCEVRTTHAKTEIIIRATHTQDVLGEKGRRIRELTALVAKRFKFPENSLELYAEKVKHRGLSAVAQAESLRYKLLGGLAIRR